MTNASQKSDRLDNMVDAMFAQLDGYIAGKVAEFGFNQRFCRICGIHTPKHSAACPKGNK